MAKLNSQQKKLALLFTFASFSAVHECRAQEFRWYEGFIFSAASSLFFTPQLFSEYIEPQPGFRGALGYRYKRFALSAESGYTQVIGTNPLVLDISLIPLVFRLSYQQDFFKRFGFRADIGTGVMYSTVIHYVDAIAYLTEDLSTSNRQTPMMEGRLYLTFSLPANIQLYAGGGIDILSEVDGIIRLPLVQAGVSFAPFTWKRKKAPPVQTLPLPQPVFQRQIMLAHFPANIAEMFEDSYARVDEAGRVLQETDEATVTLRGYAAHFGTAGARSNISQARALHIKEYLVQQYGISEGRIRIEFYGADREPETSDGSWESYRVVELIIDTHKENNETLEDEDEGELYEEN